MKKIIFAIAVMIVTLTGCNDMIDTKLEAENLLNADKAFAQYSKENGAADAFKMYLLPEAFQLPSGQEPIFGRDAICKLMTPDDDYQLLWEPQSAEVSKAGDMGYSWGIYTYIYKNEAGEKVESVGKYLNVWKKDGDNNWKVIVDIGNSSPQ